MKLLFFLPIILFFGFFGLLIIGFLFLIFKLLMKGKSASWVGQVMDKKHIAKDVDDDGFHKTEHYYHLVVKTDEGKTMKVGLAKEKYDEFNIGDKIKKEKGSFFPKKI